MRYTNEFCASFAGALYDYLNSKKIMSKIVVLMGIVDDHDNEPYKSYHVVIKHNDSYYDVGGQRTVAEMKQQLLWEPDTVREVESVNTIWDIMGEEEDSMNFGNSATLKQALLYIRRHWWPQNAFYFGLTP